MSGSNDAQVCAKLKAAMGLDDDAATDILTVLKTMSKDDLPGYLQAFLPDADAANEVAALLGCATGPATSVQKKDEPQKDSRWRKKADIDYADDDPYAGLQKGRKKNGGGGSGAGSSGASPAPIRAPIVGGATVTKAKPGGNKGGKASVQTLDSLRNAMRAGRHPCACNARRHALITNCLRCGNVICEQEGEGPCLFCGGDPDLPHDLDEERVAATGAAGSSDSGGEAANRALAFKERLLDYDRSSAKRTTVIDDQVDYFASAASDAWLSAEEKAEQRRRLEQREDEKRRARSELRVTLDFDAGKVTRDVSDAARVHTLDVVGISQDIMAREAEGPSELDCAARVHGRDLGDLGAGRKGRLSSAADGDGGGSGSNGAEDARGAHASAEDELRTCSADYVQPTGADADAAFPTLSTSAAAAAAERKLGRLQLEGGLVNPSLKHDDDAFLKLLTDPRSQEDGYLERLAARKQEERRLAENRAGRLLRSGGEGEDEGEGTGVLQDGLVILRGALELPTQQAIVDMVRELTMSEEGPGFYVPQTRGGAMHLHMMCLGKHWNAKTQRYEERRSDLDGLSVPPLPAELWKLVEAAAETATEACASVPRIEPGACLINHYAHSGRLGMHQDRSERPETLRRGSPVVSISIGDSCDFEYSETRPEETDAAMAALGGNHRVKSVRLDSGDVLIFGGPARMLFHGVSKVHPNHRPKGLTLAPGRLNLTFREL